MTKLLLSLHVLAAILAVGPIAVAASLFPRYARTDGERAAAVAALLHRVCKGYAVFGLAVPVFGFATGAQLGVLTDTWLIASVILTAIAAGDLAFAILPEQGRQLAGAGGAGGGGQGASAARLAALTGVFNLLWAAVVVLMIVRPGSTTGA